MSWTQTNLNEKVIKLLNGYKLEKSVGLIANTRRTEYSRRPRGTRLVFIMESIRADVQHHVDDETVQVGRNRSRAPLMT